ncbi:MAG: NTP transferase domain-containing protein [Oscillospiraceae bacterium]|jgi:bifunctional UDP-N-acetylglucosamine pyrophosphorylase/glucosamine-1-phosphate N-acetyltransferase/UDP-N-acetylglucosamine pyrophosphorylase|nr:NTP transferase domain-containing protein [Oscillospiraceae bacterium]
MKVIVLAAGKGTRMDAGADGPPKVLHTVCGRPMISYVLRALDFIAPADTVLVVGYKQEAVRAVLGPAYVYAEQTRQLGTGHAVLCAEPALAGYPGPVLICYGDMPLIRQTTFRDLIDTHRREGNACTLLSGVSRQPLPYGRVVRGADGAFAEIVEDADCTPTQRQIPELNAGVYVMEATLLFPALRRVGGTNAQGEYYLTDVPALLKARGGRVGIRRSEREGEILGVNTAAQLADVEARLRESGAAADFL